MRQVQAAAQLGRSETGLRCICVRPYQTLVRAFRSYILAPFHHTPPNASCRIEKIIRDQPSTVAAIEFISAFRAALPTQDPDVVAWSKQQTILVLSSIEVAPSAADARVFADIAESEGVLFFSQTRVLLCGWNYRLA